MVGNEEPGDAVVVACGLAPVPQQHHNVGQRGHNPTAAENGLKQVQDLDDSENNNKIIVTQAGRQAGRAGRQADVYTGCRDTQLQIHRYSLQSFRKDGHAKGTE